MRGQRSSHPSRPSGVRRLSALQRCEVVVVVIGEQLLAAAAHVRRLAAPAARREVQKGTQVLNSLTRPRTLMARMRAVMR